MDDRENYVFLEFSGHMQKTYAYANWALQKMTVQSAVVTEVRTSVAVIAH